MTAATSRARSRTSPTAVGGKGKKGSVNQVPLGQRRDHKEARQEETNRRLNEMRSRCHAAMAARQTCKPKAAAGTQRKPPQPDQPPPASNRQQPPVSNTRPRSEERKDRQHMEERRHDHGRRPRSPRRQADHGRRRSRGRNCRRDRRSSRSRSQHRAPARDDRHQPHEVGAVIELAKLILDRGGGRR